MTKKDIKQIFIASSILFVVIIALSWFKVGWQAKSHLRRAEELFAKEQYDEAIVEYGETIRNYTPFSRTVTIATLKLWNLTISAEQEGDLRRAVTALRELQASYYAVRSFYQPGKEWITKSNHKLDKLLPLVVE